MLCVIRYLLLVIGFRRKIIRTIAFQIVFLG